MDAHQAWLEQPYAQQDAADAADEERCKEIRQYQQDEIAEAVFEDDIWCCEEVSESQHQKTVVLILSGASDAEIAASARATYKAAIEKAVEFLADK